MIKSLFTVALGLGIALTVSRCITDYCEATRCHECWDRLQGAGIDYSGACKSVSGYVRNSHLCAATPPSSVLVFRLEDARRNKPKNAK